MNVHSPLPPAQASAPTFAPAEFTSMPDNARRFLALPLLAALLLTACGEEAPPPQMPTPEVTVVTLQEQPVRLTRELPGRTRAFLIAEVRPQVDGIVAEQLFTEGSLVEAGQALYQLDDDQYRAAYESAQASLARAKATLEVARLNAERTAELVKTNVISRQERENAVAALHQAQADVAVAEAAVQSSAVVLGYARIEAPISGRIGKSTVTRGALVTANQAAPLATVQQFDPIYVDLSQSSSELLQLREDLAAGRLTTTSDIPVTILLENGARYAHPGTFKFADVTVDPSTGSYALRVLVPNPDHLLLPGMYVRALITPAVVQDAVLAPQQGITRDPKGNATAMVVQPDGTVARRDVVVSRTIGDQWLVKEGLEAGDRVIIAGLQKIQPGMPVVVTEAGAETADGEPDEAAGAATPGGAAGDSTRADAGAR
ncbi:MAG TPA: efflux RND transporter periplasmic adaptor subunit [Woeseiaceae bacterium]|nr:efflux RND transporter periplasmic adaptor subunit [Woeseiaceae bacterium]